MVHRQHNGVGRTTSINPDSLQRKKGDQGWALLPIHQRRAKQIPDRGVHTSIELRFHHYREVHWILSGPMAHAYVPAVVHDGCEGCGVCSRSTEWFMEFARLAHRLIGINLRDCLHWGHLFDNPKPLIVPASNLLRCNQESLRRLRDRYFSLSEFSRPSLQKAWPRDRLLSQSERFEDRLTIVSRMVELWEDGQYIGWPS